jgi:hydrogenase maturation protease
LEPRRRAVAPWIVVVGCEPATLDEGIGLSPPVAAAVDPAVDLGHRLLADITEPLERRAE